MAKRNGFVIYRTYKFTSQDPAVKEVLACCTKKDSESSAASGVAEATIHNWRSHKTRRPQFATLQAVAMANGKRFVLE